MALGAQADGRDPKAAVRIDEGPRSPPWGHSWKRACPLGESEPEDGRWPVARLEACFSAEFWDTPLDQITAWNVEKWRRRKLQEGRTVATVDPRPWTRSRPRWPGRSIRELIDKRPLAKVKPGKVDTAGRRPVSLARRGATPAERPSRNVTPGLRASRARGNAWREQRHVEALPPAGGCVATT